MGIEEELAAQTVIRSHYLAPGPEVKNFEDEICQFIGLPQEHAIAVSSGTAALYLALWGYRSSPLTVGIPVYACSALRNAVLMHQSRMVYIDSGSCSPNIDAEKLNASAIDLALVNHTFGIPANRAVLNRPFIEDCAQALGTFEKGQSVGLQGEMGIFSFYATKLITTGGHGGMVVSKNREYIEQLRDYRDFDCRRDKSPRFNFQMTDLQAAIGRAQLKRLPKFLTRRNEIFKQYVATGHRFLGQNVECAKYRAVLVHEDPGHVMAKFENEKIKTIVPIEEWELLDKPENYPQARRLTQTTVSLPIYPELGDEEVDRVVRVLKSL